MATDPKNLYQRLLAITEEIGKIDKTGMNSAQGYKFIEQAQVVAEVRVQLAKHGVMIIPETVSRTMDRYTVMKPGYQGAPAKEQASFHANVVSRYTLVNADDPTDRQVCDWDAGEALDTSDKATNKATNKATTASHKYFLMKLFNISDKDDPDADSQEAPAQKAADPALAAPAPKISTEQASALMGLAKMKGMTDKAEAVEFLNQLAGADFTNLKAEQYGGFKKLVIESGWKRTTDDDVAAAVESVT